MYQLYPEMIGLDAALLLHVLAIRYAVAASQTDNLREFGAHSNRVKKY